MYRLPSILWGPFSSCRLFLVGRWLRERSAKPGMVRRLVVIFAWRAVIKWHRLAIELIISLRPILSYCAGDPWRWRVADVRGGPMTAIGDVGNDPF
jgi:hypothetical protein